MTGTLTLLLLLPWLIQAQTTPGSPCLVGQTGHYQLSGGPELANQGHLLICNGTTWNRVLSFGPTGILIPQFANAGSCSTGQSLTYDASGGIRCGPTDTIAPIWVTPAGTIQTINVNQTANAVVAASDNSGNPSYTKLSGASWLVVNSSTGLVSGKAPLTGGTYNITVRATDSSGNFTDRSFDVVVNPGGGPVGCPNPGDPCPDGTVYVGAAPEGGGHFFTTPNDAPAGIAYTFNDGSTNYLNTALPDCTVGGTQLSCRDGQYNTNQLVTMDASSAADFQYHQAARACFCWGESHTNAPNTDVPPECSGNPVGTNALDGFGYDDWYLPSLAELDVIYVNLVAPSDGNNPTWSDGAGGGSGGSPPKDGPQAATFDTGGSPGRDYLSSSELSLNMSWIIGFENGVHWEFSPKNGLRRIRCVRR